MAPIGPNLPSPKATIGPNLPSRVEGGFGPIVGSPGGCGRPVGLLRWVVQDGKGDGPREVAS
jgi:hypothetical protein